MDSKELQGWMHDMQTDISNAIERMENGTMSDNDYELIGTMLLQLDHEVRNSDSYHADGGISAPAVSVILNEVYDALRDKNTKLMQINNDMLRQVLLFGEVVVTKEDYEAMEKFKEREDGRTYIDFLPKMPHEQYMQVVEHLKEIGAKFDREAKQWYVEEDWEMPDLLQGKQENNDLKKVKENEIMNEDIKKGFFSLLIQNRTEFKKGELQGGLPPEGVKLPLPATREELHEVMKKLNITDPQDFLINGYSSPENFNLPFQWVYEGDFNELNLIAAGIERLSLEQYKELVAVLNSDSNDKPQNLDELRDLIMSYTEPNEELKRTITSEQLLFKAIYYDGKERREVFADTKENVLQAVQEAKPDRKDTDRCYIQEWVAPESGKENYRQEGIYLIASGRDVTPVEFKLPYMSSKEVFDDVRREIKNMGAKFDGNKKIWYAERGIGENAISQIKDCLAKHDEGIYLELPKTSTAEEFKALVTQLKEDGAKYNPDKKSWYITDKNNRDKFAAYLSADKPSIHAKLEENRMAAEQSVQGKEITIEPKNKDNHERA